MARDKSPKGLSATTRSGTVDDETKRFEVLDRRFVNLTQYSGIRMNEVNTAILDYGALIRKAGSYSRSDKLYGSCCAFLDKFDKLLLDMQNLYVQIEHMKEEVGTSLETEKLMDYNDFSNADITKILSKYITQDFVLRQIIDRMRREEGLDGLAIGLSNIRGGDVPETIFNISEYCEVRNKKDIFVRATCEQLNIPEKEIISQASTILRFATTKSTADKFI